MKKMFKRTVAVLISVLMIMSALPITAFAWDNDLTLERIYNISGYEDTLTYVAKDIVSKKESERTDFVDIALEGVNSDGVIYVKKGSDFNITLNCGTWVGDNYSESVAKNSLCWHYGSTDAYVISSINHNKGNSKYSDSIVNWHADYYNGSSYTAVQSDIGGTIANKVPQTDENGVDLRVTKGAATTNATGIFYFTPSSFPQLNTPGDYTVYICPTITFCKWTTYYMVTNYWNSIWGWGYVSYNNDYANRAIPITVSVYDEYDFVNNAGTNLGTVRANSDSAALAQAPANTASYISAGNGGYHTAHSFSWPVASVNNVFNEVDTPSSVACTPGTPAKENGAIVTRCTVCGGVISSHTHTYGDWTVVTDPTCTTSGSKERYCTDAACPDIEDSKQTAGIDIDDAAHTWDAGVEYESTTLDLAYVHYVCTNNGEHTKDVIVEGSELVDTSAYEAVIATAKTEVIKDAYTLASRTNLQTVLNENTIDPTVGYTLAQVNAMTTAIQTAISDLAEATYTATVYVEVDGEEDATPLTYTGVYGSEIKIDIADKLGNAYIQKWTLEQNDAVTKISMTNKKYNMIITGDVEVNVYATTENVDKADYTKVTFVDRGYNTIGYGYIADGEDFDHTSANPIGNVVAPSIAFYKFNGWSDLGNNVYRVTYAPKATAVNAFCNIKAEADSGILINNKTQDVVRYNAEFAIDYSGDKQLGMLINGKVLPITNVDHVHAPYGITQIVIVEVDDAVATSMITGGFTAEAGDKVSFNCSFYLPEGAKLVEYGLYAMKDGTFTSADLTGATKVRAQSKSTNNEYTVSMRSAYVLGETTVTGVSYVTFKDADGVLTTVYSDAVTLTAEL